MRRVLAGILLFPLLMAVGCRDPDDNSVHQPWVGQATWSWQNSYPTPVHLFDICAGDSLNLWAVGDEMTIIHSSDGGVTWREQFSNAGTNSSFSAVKLFDSHTGWAVGSDIYHTQDGGTHWIKQDNPSGGYVHGISAIDEYVCYAFTWHGSLIKTTDAGTTWQIVARPSQNITAISFIDDNIGWVLASDSLYHTTDGGRSWTGRHTGYGGASAGFDDGARGWVGRSGNLGRTTDYFGSSCAFFDETHGWVGCSGNLGYTTDGGVTWNQSWAGSFEKVVAHGQAEAWAVGLNLTNTVDGLHWRYHYLGSHFSGFGIAFSGSSRVWVVGQGGYIARSDDAGQTWNMLSSQMWYQLTAVDFVDDHTGWIVGVGAVLHTTDAGSHWNRQPTPDSTDGYYAVDFVDEEFGWAVGYGGAILSTTDGGQTWNRFTTNPQDQLSAVAFADRSNGWASGYTMRPNYGIYHTSDGGASWTLQPIPVHSNVNALSCTDALHAWGSTDVMGVVYTTDGGNSWQLSHFPDQASVMRVRSEGVVFTDNLHGCASLSDYTHQSAGLFRTIDGGLTWTAVMDTSQFWSLCFADSLHGFALGQVRDRTGIWQTSNGGAQWDFFAPYIASGMKFVNPQSGWLVGDRSKIRHYGL
jgi:photosystem II stability/assembly factor-like uncharacterized protein